MAKKGWISLNEYANKHNISVSTLRRRIKKDNLLTEMVQGKYYVKDIALDEHVVKTKQALVSEAPAQEIPAEPNQDELESLSQASLNTVNRPPTPFSDSQDASIFAVTQDLLGELKKAYMQVLQEKEEQILLLKSEIDDLRTLTHAFESDNGRLRAELEQAREAMTQKEVSRLTFIEHSKDNDVDSHPIASSDSWLELE
ncbi:MAG: hypothetical protein R2827_01620 [Bdellovibrionales bacterium]